MPISSRTPEGVPNSCPVCGKEAVIDPSAYPQQDAPCPNCGHLLWFGNAISEISKNSESLVRSPSYDELLIEVGEKQFGGLTPTERSQLIATLDSLTQQKQLPERSKAIEWVILSNSWPEALGRFQAYLNKPRNVNWALRAMLFIPKLLRRVCS